ncbi:MAG: histidine--tRNA ligase [Patescibacteria group bacterium]
MKTIKPELLGGFQDFLPSNMIARQKMISTIQRVYELYGFLPLDTPCMERWDVLTGGSADFSKSIFVSKIVRGEEDKNEVFDEQDFALRFDLTVSLARVIAAYPQLSKPFKRYQIGKVWRGESPQHGRYREFMQFDIDTIGSRSMLADTEIIQVMYEVMRALGIDKFLIRFNNRKILNSVAEMVDCGQRSKDLYRIIDKLDRIGKNGVLAELCRPPDNKYDESALALSPEQAELISRFLDIRSLDSNATLSVLEDFFGSDQATGRDGILELRQIVRNLKELAIPEDKWTIDLSVARGLDYYTGPVFETTLLDCPEIGSVFSGGRFDGLTNRFLSGSNIPGVGASVGVDRLVAALEKLGKLEKQETVAKVLVTVFGPDLMPASLRFAKSLRQADIKTELYISEEPFKAQIAYAVKQEIPFVVIIGPDEEAKGLVSLKDMKERYQVTLTKDDCLARLRISL